ncbi:MAG: hypothetical protein AB7I79_02485 [Rhizobiaceae bacterium]
MAVTDIPGVAPVTTAVVEEKGSYVDWPAIFAGAVVATTISFVLITFGSAIGLSLTSAYEGEGMSLFWFAIVAALWLLWVLISANIAGGYLTGRLRKRHGDATEHESDIRDGSHGLIVWALGVLLGVAIAWSGAASLASGVVSGAATAAAAVADEIDPNELAIDRFLRGDGAAAAEPVPDAVRGEVGRILLSGVGDAEISGPDRAYLASVVAARTGTDQAAAEQRVNELIAEADRLEAEARAAAERARKIGMVAAFIAAASLFVSAVGAYFGATLGGNHRDKQTVFADWYKPW